MFQTVTRPTRLIILLLLPVVVAATAMIWSMNKMLEGISDSVNYQEDQRTWQAVQSGFAANMQHLGNLITANAYSNESFAKVSLQMDKDWVTNLWGVGSYEVNYDTVYVLDSKGQLKIGFHEGDQAVAPPNQYYGPTFDKLLSEVPKDGITFHTLSTLALTPNGLAIVAAGPILPASVDLNETPRPPDVLVFSHVITHEILKDMGKQYIVDNLQILPFTNSNSPHVLKDKWGVALARSQWTARKPGDTARQAYSTIAIIALLTLVAAMVPLSFAYARTLLHMRRNEKHALASARTDVLSGLPNRLLFTERLTNLLPRAAPDELALMFVDLDNFKSVNDTYDHEAGDQLIRAVAAGLNTFINADETLCRLGGDEFALLVSGQHAPQRAEFLARQILAFVKEPFNLSGRIATIGASIGIVSAGHERVDASEIMRRADLAMYGAKNDGRNRIFHYNSSLEEQRMEDLVIQTELKSHIFNGSIAVAYQPIVDAATRKIGLVEVLARWPTSSSRNVPPERFVRIAEEHGLIDALGEAIMRRAFKESHNWPKLRLSINISPVQINNRDLLSTIIRIAAEESFELPRLDVELTENVLIKNDERVRLLVRGLRELNIGVALDDFGSGYASVGYLLGYRFTKVKIDRSLTLAALRDAAGQRIVQGTVLIAQGLSTEIIAEGIETEEQAKLMRLSGCRGLQGYLFGKPMPAEQLTKVLAEAAAAESARTVA